MQCFLGIYVMRASNQGLTPKKVLDSNYFIHSLHTEDQLFSSFIGVRNFRRGCIPPFVFLPELLEGAYLIGRLFCEEMTMNTVKGLP